MENNLERVQAYFKRQIVKGNYQIVEVTEAHVNTWLSILVDQRPFVIKINQLEVIQDGCITENYLQLGEFSKEQQEVIIERLNVL